MNVGQALYRKHRPKSLEEVVGQEHITTTLAHAIQQGKLSHAYLFTGPRGTGKTSVARILAHTANKLPYSDGANHLDIIEIDAASNRRIDEIRDLRDKVGNAPAAAAYKVYIIDEVHMLTREAFNALLKTLEEPPAHVIFVLATTEAHKLPETIVSRTQRFSFKPIERQKIIKHLKAIAKTEGISIEDDALDVICDHGGGSFRDSISLLDQAASKENAITLDSVQQLLGLAPAETINNLLHILESGRSSELMAELTIIHNQGIEPVQLAKQLSSVMRLRVVSGQASFGEISVPTILQQLLDVAASSNPQAKLEISLLNIVLGRPDLPTSTPNKTNTAPADKNQTKTKKPEPESKHPTSQPKHPQPKAKLNDDTWQAALQAIKQQHNTLYSLARMAEPRFKGDELILSFGFPFHQKRFNETRYKSLLAEILKDLTGNDLSISCEVSQKPRPKAVTGQTKPEPKPDTTLETISNIFGTAEVLES